MSEIVKTSDLAGSAAVAQDAQPRGPIHAVDTSDLATLIASAGNRAMDAEAQAERLEVLVCGLTGESGPPRDVGPKENSCGLAGLSDELNRTGDSVNRISGLIDRLNSLVAIGG